ncbi:undecaprenyldiphospho-muramoylpentapeptide beta-N-acetylglucosaminyltransferase [Tannockella kyphosi]|uniref:undecaprenyldiphospho-muramoylpentapeptide beta-N-acetylglucosaminyltransferase n=1 Tax=Tannockella kyphosi TaxID=2899121 RepID=UPI002013871F|nr:undecaprenyldiphospho-muramoylpentapeptide beta-N-acetylglucosaminyltransferase [Tannockella kyphosi]
MKIIISAGGTGGHLYPALAFVQYIEKQRTDVEFLFVGTTDRLEASVVPEMGYAYHGLYVKGFVGNPVQKIKNGMIFVKSVVEAKKVIKKFKPDIVVGFGGYPSASIVLAASQMKIKTLIHEQNSLIGLTNKILINKVDGIVCCYQKTYDLLPKEKTYLYGNPRAGYIDLEPIDIYEKYQIDRNKKIVLIVMGSLGSASVNKVMKEVLTKLQNKPYTILYASGKSYYEQLQNELGVLANNICLVPYIEDMLHVLKETSLIVCRGGASTLAEITTYGVPGIIIPSPYVVYNHQEFNARALVERDAARMILEADLTGEYCANQIDELIQDESILEMLKQNALSLGKPNASKDMYEFMLKIIGDK